MDLPISVVGLEVDNFIRVYERVHSLEVCITFGAHEVLWTRWSGAINRVVYSIGALRNIGGKGREEEVQIRLVPELVLALIYAE
jgi:hypothetical protein